MSDAIRRFEPRKHLSRQHDFLQFDLEFRERHVARQHYAVSAVVQSDGAPDRGIHARLKQRREPIRKVAIDDITVFTEPRGAILFLLYLIHPRIEAARDAGADLELRHMQQQRGATHARAGRAIDIHNLARTIFVLVLFGLENIDVVGDTLGQKTRPACGALQPCARRRAFEQQWRARHRFRAFPSRTIEIADQLVDGLLDMIDLAEYGMISHVLPSLLLARTLSKTGPRCGGCRFS